MKLNAPQIRGWNSSIQFAADDTAPITNFDTALAREVVAETLFIFDLALASFIAIHLFREIRKRGIRLAWTRLGNRAALAVGVHMTGLAVIRGWSTAMYWMRFHGIDPAPIDNAFQIPLFGLSLAAVGMAGCIRIFSPAEWGEWGWVVTFMVVALFIGYMQLG